MNVAVFGYECALPEGPARDRFIDGYALVPYDLTNGVRPEGFPVPTVATLLTAQFLHGSIVHIVANMLFLVAFAPQIEALLGSLRFSGFYLACGVLGGLAQISADASSHIPGIGASGAIAGVLGAYLVRYPTRGMALVVTLWAILQFVHGFSSVSSRVLSERGGGTAYFAHIGGFLAGVITLGAFVRSRAWSRSQAHRRYYPR